MQSACTASPSIRANDLDTRLPYIKCLIHRRESSGNRACTMHSYISVTDQVKINEQDNRPSTNCVFLPRDMASFNPKGYRTLHHLHETNARP